MTPGTLPEGAGASRGPAEQDLLASRVILGIGLLQLSLFLVYFSISIHPIPRWDFCDWITGYLETAAVGPWLWARHNEHRLIFNKLVVAMDVEFFGGRIYPIAVVAVGSLLGWALVLFSAVRRYTQVGVAQRHWITGCLLILIFPTTTLDIYTHPTNMQFTFVTFFFVASVVSFLRALEADPSEAMPRLRWLALALPAGVACSFASANGLFVWGVLGWMAWWYRVRSLPLLGSLALVGGLTIAEFVFGSSTSQPGAVYMSSFADLFRFLGYLTAYFGMPWVAAPYLKGPGLVLGGVLIALGVVMVLRRGLAVGERSPLDALGIALLLFSGATGLVTAFARLHLTELPAHRYAIFALLAQVGLFLLLVPSLLHYGSALLRRRGLVVAIFAFGMLVLGQQIVVGEFAAARAQSFAALRDRVLAGEQSSDVVRELYPDPQRFAHHMKLYENRGVYLYRR